MGFKLFRERFHPFCGFYMQGVLRWISMFGVIGQSWNVIHLLVDILGNLTRWQVLYNTDPIGYYLQIFVWVLFGCYITFAMSLSYILFRGANQKILSHLKIYIYGTVIYLIMVQTTFWMHTIYFCVRLPNPRFGLVVIEIPVKFYVIYAVYRFMGEIKEETELASQFRDLTEYEVREFVMGRRSVSSSFTINLDPDIDPYLGRIQEMKYKHDEFEIFRTDLELDIRAPLGSGAFATVYRALLCRRTDIQKYPVAVKTTNPLSSNVEHFKALLSELKIMTFIGTHKNIVNLIGACTEDIKKRKLYIVLELCAFGNLQTYLRSQRGTFVDLTEEVASPVSNVLEALGNDEEVTNTMDLVKWSQEIADGMEFLESRKVVHGDLAARNVLLTENKTAKITDFGLSRQLYNYAVYVKTKDSPLPWRWLALESILDMSFSTHSDIWSYGVTIWELFQLGEVPWPAQTFCVDFVKELKRGKRMDKPKYSTENIYEIMLDCWSELPEDRPTFKKLSEEFNAIFMQLNVVHIE